MRWLVVLAFVFCVRPDRDHHGRSVAAAVDAPAVRDAPPATLDLRRYKTGERKPPSVAPLKRSNWQW